MALPPKPISRHIRDLSEVVVVRWEGEWVKSIHYLSSRRKDSEFDEILYKEALAHWARYPEEDYWRITSIKPVAAGVELLELEITFLNPGKAFEVWLGNTGGNGQFTTIPEELIKTLRGKLNTRNDAALREMRPN